MFYVNFVPAERRDDFVQNAMARSLLESTSKSVEAALQGLMQRFQPRSDDQQQGLYHPANGHDFALLYLPHIEGSPHGEGGRVTRASARA
jgi:hypothetical protein